MPTYVTMERIANRALATLYNNMVFAGLVSRDYDAAFSGKQGDTVNVRVPIVFEATEFDRAEGIILQNPAEQTFPVVLDKIADVSFPVTSEDMTLVIDDFSERLLNPAMMAIVEKIDTELAVAVLDAANQTADPSGDYVDQQTGGGTVDSPDAAHASFALIEARTILGRNKMPQVNRVAVWSPEGAGELLQDPLMHEADKRGNTDGLVNAAIGRKFGFDNYETQVLGYGPAPVGSADGVAFHRDAVTIASRTLERPLGLAQAQSFTASFGGLGLRVVYGYDMTYKQNVISVDFLYGVRAIRPQGAVELDLNQGS